MPKFNLYSAWMDTDFYLWALLFAAALFALVYSIRKYIELKNSGFEEEYGPEAGTPAPAGQPAAEEEAAPLEVLVETAAMVERPAQVPEPERAAETSSPAAGPAENFVRGIYEGISGLDARLKDIEASLSKGRANNEFAVKFLEDMAADMDSLDKTKIKARIEYLLTDLKK